jgi:hypothetical protein
MKNITLAIEDTVLAQARRYAAARDTTVNALVRDYLGRIAADEDRIARAREALLGMSDQSPARLGPDWAWDREELHDRPVLSGHERAPLRGRRKGR